MAVTVPAASAASAPPAVGVTLAQVGNYLLLGGQGPDNQGVVYFQVVGTSGWSELEQTQPNTVYSPVSITALTDGGSTLVAMVAEGANNSLNLWWQNAVGPCGTSGCPNIQETWNQEEVGGPGSTYSTPSIIQIDNDVVVAAEGPDNELSIWWQQIGADGWHKINQFSEYVYSQPTMADTFGFLSIAFEYAGGADGCPCTPGQDFDFCDPATLYTEQTVSDFKEPWPLVWPGNPCIWTGGGTPTGAKDSLGFLLPMAPAMAEYDEASGEGNGGFIVAPSKDDGLDSWTPYPAANPSSSNPQGLNLTTSDAIEGSVVSGLSVAGFDNGLVGAASVGSGDLYFDWTNGNDSQWTNSARFVIANSQYVGQPSLIPVSDSNTNSQLVLLAGEYTCGGAEVNWQNLGSSTWQSAGSFPEGTFSSNC
jgi:hypothetical protein